MARILFDSDNIDAIPLNADSIAVYADQVTKYQDLVTRWPGASINLIDRGLGDPTGRANIIDVETGARKPADIPGWYDTQNKSNIPYLTAYCNRANLDAVNAAIGSLPIWRWVATLDGTLHIAGWQPPSGPAAVQFANSSMAGFHVNVSIVWRNDWSPSKAIERARANTTSLITQLHTISNLVANMDNEAHWLGQRLHQLP